MFPPYPNHEHKCRIHGFCFPPYYSLAQMPKRIWGKKSVLGFLLASSWLRPLWQKMDYLKKVDKFNDLKLSEMKTQRNRKLYFDSIDSWVMVMWSNNNKLENISWVKHLAFSQWSEFCGLLATSESRSWNLKRHGWIKVCHSLLLDLLIIRAVILKEHEQIVRICRN